MQIKKGDTPLEQRAIDANLDRLGLKRDLVGGLGSESIAEAKVKGGAEAINAVTGGGSLGLEGLHALRAKLGIHTAFGDGSGPAQALIKSAALTVKGASAAATSLLERIGQAEPMQVMDELGKLSGRLHQAAEQLEQAIAPKTLAHAGPAEVLSLQAAYQDFLSAWGSITQGVATAMKNFEALDFSHVIALEALLGASKSAAPPGPPKSGAFGDLSAAALAESAARLLQQAPLFQTGHSHLTTKSTAEVTDALAGKLQSWAMDHDFVGGAHLLTLTQMQGYAAQHGLGVDQVLAAVTAIREGHDVHGRLRQWAAESNKTFGRFFFTLSEMQQAGADIGASASAVMEALDLADRISAKNAKVQG